MSRRAEMLAKEFQEMIKILDELPQGKSVEFQKKLVVALASMNIRLAEVEGACLPPESMIQMDGPTKIG